MGQFGRIRSVRDLPTRRVLASYVREAARRARDGVPLHGARTTSRSRSVTVPRVPPDLRAAFAAHPVARAQFDRFPPGARRDYVEWILDAKRAGTRARRIETTIAWLAEGKRRNWKHERGGSGGGCGPRN
jgi:uncharacterized protein YdeI (YjbR/CyaY-like superfamily)